jgi:hypothetical protein
MNFGNFAISVYLKNAANIVWLFINEVLVSKDVAKPISKQMISLGSSRRIPSFQRAN